MDVGIGSVAWSKGFWGGLEQMFQIMCRINRDEMDIECLINVLEDENASVRHVSAETLGEIE